MTPFRQYLTDRIAELEASTEATNERLGVEGYPDIDTEVADQKELAELEALQRVLERYDAEHGVQRTHFCPVCQERAGEVARFERLTEQIREAGRALAALAEHRVDGCHGAHGPNGRCAGCERDEAISAWAKASWRWSTRERAGGIDE